MQHNEHKDKNGIFAKMHGAGRDEDVASFTDNQTMCNNIPGHGEYKAMHAVTTRCGARVQNDEHKDKNGNLCSNAWARDVVKAWNHEQTFKQSKTTYQAMQDTRQ